MHDRMAINCENDIYIEYFMIILFKKIVRNYDICTNNNNY